MTKKEIEKFLDNTKVYVDGKSAEIQKKLFSFGYCWWGSGIQEIFNLAMPFLFIHDDRSITHTNDMELFSNHRFREITADKILSLEITEPSYRPFKTQEECWNEMFKHQPFGWIKAKDSGNPRLIGNIYLNIDEEVYIVWTYNGVVNSASNTFYNYTFADGTPFGIKED